VRLAEIHTCPVWEEPRHAPTWLRAPHPPVIGWCNVLVVDAGERHRLLAVTQRTSSPCDPGPLTLIPDGEQVVGDYLREHPSVVALGARVAGRTPSTMTQPVGAAHAARRAEDGRVDARSG
jgi:hypothetical protein